MIDRSYKRFGFREFWIKGDRFFLNGKEIFLQGEQAQFYLHTSYSQNRRWLTLYFKALRDANVNFVRLPMKSGCSWKMNPAEFPPPERDPILPAARWC